MADQRKLELILKLQDEATKELKKISKDLGGVSKSAGNAGISFKKMTGAVILGNAAYNALAGILRTAVHGMGNLIKESITLNGRLEQSKAVIYKLGENNDWTREKIDKLVKSIREENKDMLTAINLTKTAIMTNLDDAQALEIVARGRDVAAAANRNSNDAIKAMMQAVVKLRPELLSEYGIELNLIKVYKDTADSLGIKTSQLTYAQKTQAMYNAIIKESIRTEGAYEEAMGSWYKMSQSVKDGIVTLKIVLGDLLDNGMAPIVSYVYQTIKSFNSWAFTTDNELNPQLKALADLIGSKVTAAFFMLLDMSKGLVAFFKSELANTIKDKAIGSFNSLMDVVIMTRDFFLDFKNHLQTFFNFIDEKTGLVTLLTEAWQMLTDQFNTQLLPALQELWKSLEPYQPYLIEFAKVLGTILLGAVYVITYALTGLAIAVMKGIEWWAKWETFLNETWTETMDSVTDQIADTIVWLEKIIDKFKSAWEWAQKVGGSIGGAVSGAIANIPGRAAGGPVAAGSPYMVGEEGPELFVPRGSGTIIPNGQGGGMSVNVVVNGDVSGQELVDKVTEAIMASLRANTRSLV